MEELVCFFAHTGRHYEEARKAAQLLLSFEPEETIRQLVEKGEREKWNFEKIQNNNGRTHPVALKKPNELGLYDMSGNVYDWCADWFDWEFYEECRKEGGVENPVNDKGSKFGRVLRGGSWFYNDDSCRVVFRNYVQPNNGGGYVGWRAAQDL